jgi:hypothetical protein
MQAEALIEQRALETRHIFSVQLYRSAIVSQATVGVPQVALHREREAHLTQISSNRHSALAEHEGVLRFACRHKMGEQIASDPSQPLLIPQDFSAGLGFLQADQDLSKLAQGP